MDRCTEWITNPQKVGPKIVFVQHYFVSLVQVSLRCLSTTNFIYEICVNVLSVTSVRKILPFLPREKIVWNYWAKRVRNDRNLSLESGLVKCQLCHDHVHLVSDCFENTRSEAWVQICQGVRHRVVVGFFRSLPLWRNRDAFKPVAKSVWFFNFSFPIDNMSHNLIFIFKAATA